jgi:hypothetical protein
MDQVKWGDFGMRFLGFILLVAGWLLVLAAIVILAAPVPRAVFVCVGLAIEILGLVFVFRSHSIPREEKG